MTAERFNGIKLNPERMTDTELINLVTHRMEVLERTANEVERLSGILRDRGAFATPEDTQDKPVDNSI